MTTITRAVYFSRSDVWDCNEWHPVAGIASSPIILNILLLSTIVMEYFLIVGCGGCKIICFRWKIFLEVICFPSVNHFPVKNSRWRGVKLPWIISRPRGAKLGLYFLERRGRVVVGFAEGLADIAMPSHYCNNLPELHKDCELRNYGSQLVLWLGSLKAWN